GRLRYTARRSRVIQRDVLRAERIVIKMILDITGDDHDSLPIFGKNQNQGTTRMPDDLLKPALRAALRVHEIGDASPYQLSFAGKGKSGASFGFMQGDLAAGQSEVKAAFSAILADAGMDPATVAGFLGRLSVHLVGNPLTPPETTRINAALLAG